MAAPDPQALLLDLREFECLYTYDGVAQPHADAIERIFDRWLYDDKGNPIRLDPDDSTPPAASRATLRQPPTREILEKLTEQVASRIMASAEHKASSQSEWEISEALIDARCDGHGEGQEHAVADVNAGLIDDMIAPRLQRERATLRQQIEQLPRYPIRIGRNTDPQTLVCAEEPAVLLADLRGLLTTQEPT